MRRARIYKPTKTATQSGQAARQDWCLEFLPTNERYIEPIMGWTGSRDMLASEVKLYFKTKEDAIGFAEREKIEYDLIEPHKAKIKIKSYSDNFKHHPHG